MPEGKLRLKTLELLINRHRSLTFPVLALKTGLPEEWLKSFRSRGAEKDAGSDRVVKLYEFLSETTLDL